MGTRTRAPGQLLLVAQTHAHNATQASVDDAPTYKYCLRDGTMPLLRAAAAWFAEHYGVTLDARTQALSLIGSQEGLAHLLLSAADPGDGILLCKLG